MICIGTLGFQIILKSTNSNWTAIFDLRFSRQILDIFILPLIRVHWISIIIYELISTEHRNK